MKKLTIICLLALLSGCATTGPSGGCSGAHRCDDARLQIMHDALYNRPFGH